MFITILTMISIVAFAQDFGKVCQDKLQWFKKMEGRWEGTSWQYSQQGERSETQVAERVEFGLDGTIVSFRGLGTLTRADRVDTVHNALGILSYNPFSKEYQLNSWIDRGMSTTAQVEILTDDAFSWSFMAGDRTIRYHVKVQGDTWVEKGETSTDGEQWFPFMGMELSRVRLD